MTILASKANLRIL